MLKLRLLLFFSASLIFSIALNAQTKYPLGIFPNQEVTLNPKFDTLWVITDTQIRRTIVDGRTLRLQNDEISVLKQQINEYKNLNSQQDSLKSLLINDRDFYKEKWTNCSKNIDIVGNQALKQQRRTKIAVIGGIAGTIIGFVSGMLIFYN